MRDVKGGAVPSPVPSSGPLAGPAAATAGSCADFVATRGPALYRLAHLLAGDVPEAERLLQVALVRLHLDWRRATRAGSAEEHARGLVVDTFLAGPTGRTARLAVPACVRVPPDQLPDEDPAGLLDLWALLPALPPRERAVLVLRGHEQLADIQVGALVRRPPRVVGSLAAGALDRLVAAGATGDHLPERLEAELREVAGSRVLPVVDPEGLARLAAAERVRRRKVLLASLALAGVLVLAVAVLSRPSGGGARAAHSPTHPTTLAQLAPGPDARLPWWSGGELHLGDRVLPTNHETVVFGGGTTLVGDFGVEDDHPHAAWWYVDGHRLVPLASSSRGVFEPVVSPRGDLVAWAVPDGSAHRRLVLWSTAGRHVLGAIRLPVHVTCCGRDVDIRGIDSQGRVLFRTSGAVRVWSPDRPVGRIHGIASALYDVSVWPGGVTWRPYDNDRLGPFPVSYGILDPLGRLHAEGRTPEGSVWAPDGARYAWTVESSALADGGPRLALVRVRHVITGRTSTMRLPRGPSYQLVGWESTDDLVVAVRRDTGRPLRGSDLPTQVQLLRCHVDTGACETAGLAPESILTLSSS